MMAKEQHDPDPKNTCGHTVRDRLNVFQKGGRSTCILCLHERIKAKDEEIKRLTRIIELDEEIEKSWKAGTQPPAKS